MRFQCDNCVIPALTLYSCESGCGGYYCYSCLVDQVNPCCMGCYLAKEV